MRVNPKLANLQYMYANGDSTTGLPEGTLSNLAAAKYVKDNDKNKDKCLSSDEVTLSQAAFDKLDADNNGKIDLKEMKAGLKGQDAAIESYYTGKKTNSSTDYTSTLLDTSTSATSTASYSTKAAASYVSANDKNGDGSLSNAEASLSTETFNALDTDKSGSLEQDEVQAAIKSKESAFKIYYSNNVSSRVINGLTSSLLKTI